MRRHAAILLTCLHSTAVILVGVVRRLSAAAALLLTRLEHLEGAARLDLPHDGRGVEKWRGYWT